MSSSLQTKFEAFLLTEKRVASNTFAAYKRDIDQFVGFFRQKDIDLAAISRTQVKEYLKHLKHDLNLTSRSIMRKISALKVLFKYLHEHAQFPNLAEDLSFPKLEKKLPTFLTENQIQQLLQEAEKDTTDHGVRNKIILYLLYVTGMRISELVAIEIPQFQFDAGFIHVQGKGGKARMVPIPQAVLEMVKEYIAKLRAQQKNAHQQSDYLFPILYSGSIKHITRQAVWVMLKQLCIKAGIKQTISPHQLRHSLATHMLKSGVDLRSLQLLLGHENLATVQVYTHLETSYLRQVYDKKHPRS